MAKMVSRLGKKVLPLPKFSRLLFCESRCPGTSGSVQLRECQLVSLTAGHHPVRGTKPNHFPTLPIIPSIAIRLGDLALFFFFFNFYWRVVTLQCCVKFLLYSKVTQLCIYRQPFSPGFPSRLGRHRALPRVPRAVEPVLTSYLFYHSVGRPCSFSPLWDFSFCLHFKKEKMNRNSTKGLQRQNLVKQLHKQTGGLQPFKPLIGNRLGEAEPGVRVVPDTGLLLGILSL